MVTVIDLKNAQNREGQDFIALVLSGPPVAVQSQETGKFYITARSCQIPCTFDPTVAQTMIGQQLPGTIEKVECTPYEYTIKETGEIVQLDYTWEYNPTEKPKVVAPAFKAVQFSANGHLEHA